MPDIIEDDLVQPFQIDSFELRGRLVRLGPLVDQILTRHNYPEPVAELLGEAIVLAVALARALKYEGVFTLQTKGDGPVKLMVADVTTAGAVRGYAQVDQARLAQVIAAGAAAAQGPVPRLLGAGYLALTVDQGEHTERYQGIVELQGASLVECVHHYFRQSEQVEAGLKVAVARVAGSWRAGCLMIERLPEEDRHTSEDADEGWRRAMILMSSSTSKELVDPALSPERLLYRLFHEEGVRAYRKRKLAAECRCSRGRVETMLRALDKDDVRDMTVEGQILVTCEFCSAVYAFAADEVAALAAD
ncbi:MAG TPA: Hsp33 family molecular chaperone [Stellaceae bacterium]|nr:Hsp33 family molecular chaperone [Stellaceae bacterium]